MIEILNEPEMKSIYGNSVEGFKTSSRWIFAFMKRYKLSRRRHTKISQKLPEQTNESLTKFQRFTIQLRKKKHFEMSNILNMDETPVWFDMAGNFTIDQIGEKTVHIRSTGNEKNRFMVVLTCAAGWIYYLKSILTLFIILTQVISFFNISFKNSHFKSILLLNCDLFLITIYRQNKISSDLYFQRKTIAT